MSDDIVTRLTKIWENFKPFEAEETVCDAIDEIDRLKMLLNHSRSLAQQFESRLNEQNDEIERLIADRDRWRSIAERAMANCDQAIALLEGIQKAVHHD